MNLVDAPLTRVGRIAPVSRTVRAMEAGQHVMAVALTAIGAIRAISDGVSPAAAIIAGVAVLAWHTAGTLLPSRHHSTAVTVWWLIGLAAIWVAAVAVSPEFVWVAFLLWLLAGHLLPVGWSLLFSALVLAVTTAAPIMHHGTTTYANVFGPLIGGVFAWGIARGYLQLLRDATEREQLVASLRQAQQETVDLQDELALTQRQAGAIAERTRIARDLHDTVAQALSSIRLLAHAEAARPGDAAAQLPITQIEGIAADGIVDVRRIIAALAPAELDEAALSAALGRLGERLHDETGMQVVIHPDDALPALSTLCEIALLRTAQSALANVRLHAAATRVDLTLQVVGHTVRLDIADDGRGFDVREWEQHGGSGSSYGLRFMRQRLRELGGDLEIESAPGEGTVLSAHLPLREPSAGFDQGPGLRAERDPGFRSSLRDETPTVVDPNPEAAHSPEVPPHSTDRIHP